jgi:photosystem II stability/assembly factor-like uncharacterized protein
MKGITYILSMSKSDKTLKCKIGLFLFTVFLFAAIPVWAQIDVISIAVSPDYASDSTVFAGTADCGVYKSTNGGITWTEMNGVNDAAFTISVSPNYLNDTTIFVGSYDGVYKSTNGGLSWSQMNNGLLSHLVYSIAISPNYANDATVFAAVSGSNSGIYKSTNGGQTWTRLNSGITSVFIYAVAISPNYANDSTIFAGTWGGYEGVYKSTNGGLTWAPINNGISFADRDVWSMAISPNYANDGAVIAHIGGSGSNLYKSTDGGLNWSKIAMFGGFVVISPNYADDLTIFAGHYKSTDDGQTWTQILSGEFFYQLAISPDYANDSTVFAAMGDYKGVYRSSDGGLNWTQMDTGLTPCDPYLEAVVQPNGGEIIPSGSSYTVQWNAPTEAVKFELQLTKNNGTSWALIAKNITNTNYNWTVPKPTANKTKCLVRITGYNSLGVMVFSDASDNPFTIEVAKLLSPDGGEILTSGNPHTITWRTNGTKKTVAKTKLKYSCDGGIIWKQIITLTGNPGSYSWNVSPVSTVKTQCKVKVVLKDTIGNTLGTDVSDVFFTIQP